MPAVEPIEPDIWDDDDGWQDMPIVREDEFLSGMDEEDRKKYHYQPSAKAEMSSGANATGALLDVDDFGNEWRSKLEDQNEGEYTRLRVNEEDDADEVHMRTRYLFDEDKAMTPLSQMQATKELLTEAQRIAYVGLCKLTSREMAQSLKLVKRKELKHAVQNMELWAMKIMGRLYYHMELETQEQKMIESLAEHGVNAMDLVPSLMTTHTVANPEYDPAEARRQADEKLANPLPSSPTIFDAGDEDDDDKTLAESTTPTKPAVPLPQSTSTGPVNLPKTPATATFQTTQRVLEDTAQASIPGVSTSLSSVDERVTLDIRWTVLCDLFLVLIADSVYDARSRVLLERVALKLGLGWVDVVKFESRVTEALEIQESVEQTESQDVIEGRNRSARKKRYMMVGLATLGGGLVIGLSAGLLAPVIGAGLGAAFTTIGVTGTTSFLAGTGGAAVITTGGILTGSGIAAKGMTRRTQQVRTFDILPLHNNKRVNCILTVPGFMSGAQDDVRLPFSVLDPVVGDVFSVLWEPEMIRETGSALKILTTEVLTQLGQTVLQATVMTALMSALQWPIILTKLGYLIDNPWNNALDRARAAGSVLADILIHRHLGVRPITLIGFSLGARVIFYALQELHKQKAFGVVQDVFLLGATLTASQSSWCKARAVVSGRFVNAYARNDWVLNYLFRMTSGGVGTVAGLRPVPDVPELENVDVTDKIAGHMSYRTFMPLILDQLGFPVFADYFDEPEDPDFEGDRIVVTEDNKPEKKGWFGRKKSNNTSSSSKVSRPPSATSPTFQRKNTSSSTVGAEDDDLPPRTSLEKGGAASPPPPESGTATPPSDTSASASQLPIKAGFDFSAIKDVIGKSELDHERPQVPEQQLPAFAAPHIPPPTQRSESAPPPMPAESPERTPVLRASFDLPSEHSASSREDLSATFARSTSLGDVPLRQEESTRLPSPLERAGPSMPSASRNDLGFSSWSAGKLGQSTETLTFGNNSRSISTTGGSGGYVSPAPADFAAYGSPGLSFGGSDGTITFSPTGEREADPWDRRPARKETLSFSANPWGS